MKNNHDDEFQTNFGLNSLILKNVDYNQVDYSNHDLHSVCVINGKFNKSKFENLNVEDASFGAGGIESLYVDCSFDNSKFSVFSGIATFIRCSFKNIVINELFANTMQFIDCTFSGKLKKTVFTAKIPESSQKYLDRDFNKVEGNDFSQVDFSDVGFRGGIDLLKQKLPDSEDYLYLYDPTLIDQAKEKLLSFPEDKKYAEDILSLIRVFEFHMTQGQKHFFLKLSDYARTEDEKNEVKALFNL